MLLTRLRQAKSRKGMTLVEMIAAVAITAILAAVLSMMIVPVINTYRTQNVKVELSQAATSRLNDMAMYLRGATGIYLSTATYNPKNYSWYPGTKFNDKSDKIYNVPDHILPEIRRNTTNRLNLFNAVKTVKCRYAFVMDNYYERSSDKVANYRYPEFIIADYSDENNRYLDYASTFGRKLASDDYQSKDISCPGTDNTGMYFLVKKNADDNNSATVLEMHLTVQKGSVTYEGIKTIVCENLVVQGDVIYTVALYDWEEKNGAWYLKPKAAKVTTNSETTKYYSVWFSIQG